MRIPKTLVMLSAVASIVMSVPTVFASRPQQTISLPDQAGLYDVPGHANLKLRVLVYNGQPTNPGNSSHGGSQPPSLVCAPTITADPDSSTIVNPAGWTLPSNWQYRLNVASTPSTVGSANSATLVGNGYAAWLQHVSAVTVTRGSDTTVNRSSLDGQNVVTWGRTSGSALATTYVWYDTTTHVATEIDTVLNQKFTWYWSDPASWASGQTCAYSGVYDAQDILTHELGHTFGLDDEYATSYTNNTMYGYGAKSEAKKDTLTTGDISGVSALY